MRVVHWCLCAAIIICTCTLARAANTIQNFSADFPVAGDAAAIRAVDNGQVFADGSPAVPSVVPGWDGKAMRLTHDQVNSQLNGIGFNQVVSGPWETIQFEMGFQITDIDGFEDLTGADGISFAYAASASYGPDNKTAPPSMSEEPNLRGSLGVGFDSWSNSDVDGTPNATLPDSISLHWDNALVETIPMGDLGVDDNWIENGNPKFATIKVTGDGKVTVAVADQVTGEIINPWTDFAVPGLAPYDGRVVFGSRTGGENANHDIDNVVLKFTPPGGAEQQILLSNFEEFPEGPLPVFDPELPPLLGGTPFTATRAGSSPRPQIINQGPGPGPNEGFLQLSEERDSQHNFIAFDKTSDDSTPIHAEFDFQIRHVTDSVADGMAFVLAPTSQYGTTGELAQGAPWNPAEEPNLAGGLGIGFDTFNNGAAPDREESHNRNNSDRANHISLHWDGQLVDVNGDGSADNMDIAILNRTRELNLANGKWNHAVVDVNEDAAGMHVTLTLTDGNDNSVHTVFDNVTIPGASFGGPVRAAFGARTGGASDFQSIDNVNIRFGIGGLVGDFDDDGDRDINDVNALIANITPGPANPAKFDLTNDGQVNQDDLTFWAKDPSVKKTWIGDSNLDGEFNTGDLVQVFQRGKFELNVAAGWDDGDWTGDARFGTGDLVAAFQDGGFEKGPRAAVASVPEPASGALALLGGLLLFGQRGLIRRRK